LKKTYIEWRYSPKLEFCKQLTEPQKITVGNVYIWTQVIIENVGKTAAKNVRLYFTGIESDSIENFERYMSIPVRTSWEHLSVIEELPPNVKRSWDLGVMTKDAGYWAFELAKTPREFNFLYFPEKIGETKQFKVQLTLCADNAKSIVQVILIKLCLEEGQGEQRRIASMQYM
jgi:hypothetical protein